MDWDKPSIIAVVLGVAIIVGWYAFGPGIMPQSVPPPAAPPTAAAAQPATPAARPGQVPAVQSPALPAMPVVSIAGPESEYTFQPVSGTLQSVKLSGYLNAKQTEALNVVNDFPPLAGVGTEYGAFGLRAARGGLTVVEVLASRKTAPNEYVLSRLMRDSEGAEFIVDEKFQAVEGFRLKTALKIVNPARTELTIPALVISAGDLSPWHRLSGDAMSKSQEVHTLDYCTDTGKVKSVDASAKPGKWTELTGAPVRWFGSSNRFFAMLFKSDAPMTLRPDRMEAPAGSKEFVVNASGTLDSFELAPGAARELTLEYYLGPKQPKQLRAFDALASKVMRLGWFPIDFLAYIMLALLNWIHAFVGSFGWSIILLTLLVRLVFFPVTMKANASMREMQALTPEIKAIREKYKSEPLVAQSKISELYKARHVNPVGGCLPMLIQIPVFIALYYALGSAAELRQQGFWWIKDLAQPDTVAHIFGLPINPLIIAWTGLMIVQQKITPTAMDPMQAKMMLAMPLVMLFILYNLPAGLTLYWAVSQIFSIAQMYYQQHTKKREEQSGKGAEAQTPPPRPKIVRS